MINAFKIDVQINKNLQNSDLWRQIIDQWVQNNIDYLEVNNFEDATYWHNEMANISCLVGAIWKIGGVAISEYTINKDTIKNGTKTNGENNNGRADLYFSINKTKYLVESKYIRHYDNKGNKFHVTEKLIKSNIRTAIKDCQSCNESGLDNKMAMVFASPISSDISLNLNDNDLDYDIKVMLKIIGEKKPKYKKNEQSEENTYDTVYLFGQYYSSSDTECAKKKCPKNY